MFELELDIFEEDVETVKREATGYGLEATLLEEHGPAGGNPVYLLRGTYKQLFTYVTECYFQHESDEDFQAALEHWNEYPPTEVEEA